MKRVRINTGKIGLVFQNEDYVKVLTEGSYWLSPFQQVKSYDMTKSFNPSIVNLNVLLRDQSLVDLLEIVEVEDHEIALQYENKNFKQVLSAGKHAFWKGIIQYTFTKINLKKPEITEAVHLNILKRAELSPYIRSFVVESYEQGVLLMDGKYQKLLETGIYFYWNTPTVIQVLKVDLRQTQLEVSGQEILTQDKAALRLNFYAQYKVVDVIKALTDNKDYSKQLYIFIQLALREFVGTITLDELLDKKETISEYVLQSVKDKVYNLGVELMNAGIRDIILPGDVKEIMNQVLVAQKKAQANTITRREETASTRSLLNTAKLMEENEMLFKLKEMEYVEKIADKINSISLSGGNQVVDQLKEIFSR